MKKRILLIIMMFMFITNVNALTFNVDVTNIEDEGNGTLGTITNIDIANKEVTALFQDIGDEVNFSVTITNNGNRAGTLREITVTSTNDKMQYTNNLPDGGLAINGNDTNKVTITAKVKEGAVNGTSTSQIKINYTYDEGSCPDGEILSDDESMCLCPEGLVRNDEGVCIKTPIPVECATDEIYNETKKICEKKVVPVVPSNPKTLDNIILITLLFIVSGLGIYAVMFKRLNTSKKKITVGVITGVITLGLSFTVLAGVFGLDNLLSAIVNPITKSTYLTINVNENIDLIETWDGDCDITDALTPSNIFQGGSGTEQDPYQIKTANQLACFAKSVNEGTTYEGQYIKQIKHIKLNDNLNTHAEAGDLSNAHVWISAGCQYWDENTSSNVTRTFAGQYDGDNYKISGLYITNNSIPQSDSAYKGLFGHSTNATFKNIILADVYMNTTGKTGALLGYGYKNLTLNNITTYGTGMFNDTRDGYKSDDGAGIISNFNGNNEGRLTIDNTTNNVNITCKGSCAGVIERLNGFPDETEYNLILRNVTNNGNIAYIGDPSGTGGIIGYCQSYPYPNVLIDRNANTGNLVFGFDAEDEGWSSTGYSGALHGGGVGGLYGYIDAKKINITNTYNTGNITGFNSLGYFGGISSSIDASEEFTMDNCWNSGDMIATYVNSNPKSYAAGLIGGSDSDYAVVRFTNCFNTGDINSPNSQYVAGIIGKFEEYGYNPEYDPVRKIENCYNTGDMTGMYGTGGIAGQFSGEIIKCYNTGAMTATTNTSGGILGYGGAHIYNSYNLGTVSINGGGAYIGGLCPSGCEIIKNSYNRGDLIVQNQCQTVGGIVGQRGIVSNSYNSGKIYIKTAAPVKVGGIGADEGTFNNVYNLGDIVKEHTGGTLYAGGITMYGNVTNSVNKGNITAVVDQPLTSSVSMYIGGISYYKDESSWTGTLSNNFNAGTITIDDSALDTPIREDGFSHTLYIGEVLSTKYGTLDTSLGNKFNKNANGVALGCYGPGSCTLEESQYVGSYTTEEAPDILSIINGDNAFEIKDGEELPTLKIFNN